MPSYAYLCSECDEQTEIHASIGTARRVIDCAYCGKLARIRVGAGVNIAPSALENKGAGVREIDARGRRWDKDMPAYKRMRHRGMQPRAIDGSAMLEDQVHDQVDINFGSNYHDPNISGSRDSIRRRIEEGVEQAKEIMEEAGNPKVEPWQPTK